MSVYDTISCAPSQFCRPDVVTQVVRDTQAHIEVFSNLQRGFADSSPVVGCVKHKENRTKQAFRYTYYYLSYNHSKSNSLSYKL